MSLHSGEQSAGGIAPLQLVAGSITVAGSPEPFSADYFVEQYIPESGKSGGRRRLMLFLALVLMLLALAAVWRWTPLQSLLTPERIGEFLDSISSHEGRAAIAIGGFIVASLAMVPVTLLAVICGVVFDGWQAFLYVLAGAMGASAIGFMGGRYRRIIFVK